jgi:hypothetical protein
MNVRKVNLGLWTLTAGLAAGAVVCAGLGVFTPVEVDAQRDGVGPGTTAATSQGSMGSQLSLAEFESIWRLNLRKSLTDTPASAPVADATSTPATTAAGAGGPFVLIGTIGDSLAMIRTASGAVELKGLGESVNGAKIVAIRPAQVDVESDGRRMTVAKLREGSGG